MSVEGTNTPNGASSDLYLKNEDVNKQELTVTDMSQKDPTKDLTGNIPGDNTVAEEYVIINNTTAIRDFGSVRIGATLVGQPVKAGIESRTAIKADIDVIKRKLVAKGALTAQDYIKAKKEALEKENKEEKAEELEKDDEK